MKKPDVSIYSQSADHYDSTLSSDYVQRFYGPVKAAVARYLKPTGTSILDLCCGTGVIAKMLLDLQGVVYIGVDLNLGFLKKAQERTSGSGDFSFVQADVSAFDPRRKFDLVLAINAYHHVENPMKSQFLQRANNLLTPEGILIIYEMLISRLSNEKDFAKANEDFYLKRIEWIKRNESVSEKKLDAWLNVCALSMHAEEEYKVDYDYLIEDLDLNGFVISEQLKTWPDDDLFEGEKVGDYIFSCTKRTEV